MPKHKLMARGQITIIIIIGLIIAAGIGLAVFLIPHGSAPASDKDPVSHVETCLRSAAFSGIELLGKQGMIYPKAYIASQDDKIAYYYFRGKSFFPEKKDLEEELTELFCAYAAKKAAPKIYRQFKMYNDPRYRSGGSGQR